MADFARVNPAGWAKNQTFTSAQANTLDIDHSNSLNRTGGNITGTVTVKTSGGKIVFATASTNTYQSGSTATWQAGSILTLQSGCVFTSATASSFTGPATLKGGVTHLLSGASTLLKTTAGGRFQLGDNDYPTFSATRAINKTIDLASTPFFGTGWSNVVDGLTGPATTNDVIIALPHLPHQGARLAQIDIMFTPIGGHAGLPAVNIAAAITTRQIAAGVILPTRALYTSMAAYAPVGLADYNNGQVKTLSVFQATVIDNTITQYALRLTDESGVNALAGNVFHQIILYFDTISDMRFQ